MNRSQMEWLPGLWLDARRAVWIEECRTLVVADMHLGYVWAHRLSGQLLPMSAPEDSKERLLTLIDAYQPREVVLLGDVLHGALPTPALREEILGLFAEAASLAPLKIVLGNHDAHLPALLADCGIPLEMARQVRAGKHLLMHGDGPDDALRVSEALLAAAPEGRVIIGHEHPSITLSDGVASSVRCPCFLASREVLVLPAFSLWAAGTNIREGRFMSAFARRTQFTLGVAILADKLLPVKLSSSRG